MSPVADFSQSDHVFKSRIRNLIGFTRFFSRTEGWWPFNCRLFFLSLKLFDILLSLLETVDKYFSFGNGIFNFNKSIYSVHYTTTLFVTQEQTLNKYVSNADKVLVNTTTESKQ